MKISKPSIARSTALMSTATALSRVTGFIRMWATALALGATGLMSAYSVANNIPNMIFELVAGGILSSLFIPTFLELREANDEKVAWAFASHVFNLVVLALGVVAVLGTFLPEPFIWTQTFRSGSDSGAVRELGSFFFRFFAIQVVIYGAGMVMQGLLNAQRKYLWTALGPVFNNLVVIATMIGVFLMSRGDAELTEGAKIVLAAGTTLGVVAMFGVMVPALIRSGVRYTPQLGLRDPAVRRMLVLAVPTLVYVITNLVGVSFRNASALAVDGAGPSWLMYAWTFYQLPYGILAVALATAVFTELADTAGRKDWQAFKTHVNRGLNATILLIMPSAAMLIALAEPLVSLYRVGNFAVDDVPMVAGALRWWAVGLVFFACMMFVLRVFYSLKDTRTPAIANLGLTGIQIGLYIVLSSGIARWAGLGIIGIPIADGVFYVLLLGTLLFLLRRRIGSFGLSRVAGTFARMLVASLVGGGLAYGASMATATLGSGLTGAMLQLLAGAVVGLGAAFGVARLLGVSELAVLGSLLGRVRDRLSRKPRGTA